LLKEIVIAFQSWSDAHRFIKERRYWKWIIVPGILYTLLFIVAMIVFWKSSDSAVSWASNQLRIEPWLQQERNEWLSFFFVMMGMMLRLTLVLFYFSLFKYLILIIGSPVFAYLSEKIEGTMDGKEHSFDWPELKKDCIRSIRMALRNCGWQSVYLLALLLLSLIPIAGWIAPLIALLMECYYYGCSMLDYSLARNGFTPTQSTFFIGRHKGLAIANGCLFYFMHIVIIFAPAYAIIAGTLTVHKVKNT
jgi:CysZ protein